jgi:hypothetical protein
VVEQDSGMEILDWDDGESINDAIVDGISRKNDRRRPFQKMQSNEASMRKYQNRMKSRQPRRPSPDFPNRNGRPMFPR